MKRRWLSWSLGLICLSVAACTTPPPPVPCTCQVALDKLERQTDKYHQALNEIGNLRHQLTICHERP